MPAGYQVLPGNLFLVKQHRCVVRGTRDLTRGKAPGSNRGGIESAAQRQQSRRSDQGASAGGGHGIRNPMFSARQIHLQADGLQR